MSACGQCNSLRAQLMVARGYLGRLARKASASRERFDKLSPTIEATKALIADYQEIFNVHVKDNHEDAA